MREVEICRVMAVDDTHPLLWDRIVRYHPLLIEADGTVKPQFVGWGKGASYLAYIPVRTLEPLAPDQAARVEHYLHTGSPRRPQHLRAASNQYFDAVVALYLHVNALGKQAFPWHKFWEHRSSEAFLRAVRATPNYKGTAEQEAMLPTLFRDALAAAQALRQIERAEIYS